MGTSVPLTALHTNT